MRTANLALIASLALSATAPVSWGNDDRPPKESKVLEGHKDLVRCIAFSPDGDKLASGSNDGTIRLWEVGSGKEQFVLDAPPTRVGYLAFGADGKTLVASGLQKDGKDWTGAIQIWDLNEKKIINTIKFPGGVRMAISPDRTMIATTGGRIADFDIYFWDAKTGKEVGCLSGRETPPDSFAFSATGNLLAVGGGGGAVEIWDWKAKKKLSEWKVHSGPVIAVTFTPDGRTLATAAIGERIKLSDVERAKVSDTIAYSCSEELCLTYSPKGGSLATSDGHLYIIDAAKHLLLRELEGHEYPLKCVVFSPDGKLVAAAGGKEKNIRIWEAPEE
jgi:WD40 repeat protein